MNITTQTKTTAQVNQLHHSGVFMLNGPSNCVVANMVGQFSQQFKQHSDAAQLFVGNNITDVTPCITRIRLVMHDACILFVQSMVNSLEPRLTLGLEQNELYFWKRDQRGISNG